MKRKRNRNLKESWEYYFVAIGLLLMFFIYGKILWLTGVSFPDALMILTLIAILWLLLSALIFAFVILLVKISDWSRKRTRDRRIIRQAKAAGVWDKYPTVLGGRALELKAWERYRIIRLYGETDKELRHRIKRKVIECMILADSAKLEELALVELKIGRMPGESDADLRRRCMEKVDREQIKPAQ